jgi:hypothetical protein
MQTVFTPWRLAGLLAVALVPLASGCGAGTGHVSGKVLQKDGQPLPGGIVTFFPQRGGRGNPVSTTINPDGSYDAPSLPAGPVKIAVNNDAFKKGAESAYTKSPIGRKGGPPHDVKMPTPEGPGLQGTYVPIDARNADPEHSGLVYEVQPGTQSHNVELK